MIHILVARLLHMVYTESVTLDDEGDVNVSEAYLSILSELMSLAAAFNHFMDVVDSQVLRTGMALTNLSHLKTKTLQLRQSKRKLEPKHYKSNMSRRPNFCLLENDLADHFDFLEDHLGRPVLKILIKKPRRLNFGCQFKT